jgi:hypothetical protein
MISTIPEVDVPNFHGSTILCFKLHLLAGLGLPSSKFLAAIINYLGCSLVHFNTNAFTALSSIVVLCDCWLSIPADFSLLCTITLCPGTLNSFMVGSDYICATTIGMSIFWRSSSVARKIHIRSGF